MRRIISALATIAIVGAGAVLGSVPHAAGHNGHSITVTDTSASEGAGKVTFTLSVSPAPETGETVSVSVATSNNTATGGSNCSLPGTDYVTLASTTVTFTAGQTAKGQDVSICQDTAIEGNQTFFLNLSNPTSNAAVARFQGVATIIDDEQFPSLSMGNRSAAEGNSGTSTFQFAVTLSVASAQTVTVHYATADGTATAPSDYTAQSANLTFPPGSTTQNVNVPVAGDSAGETDETFFVNLSAPTNATISNPQGTGMIQNDDTIPTGPRTLRVNDVTAAEGNTGFAPTTPFTFTVTLSQTAGPGNTIGVNFNTGDGTAFAGSDYTGTSGTLEFTGSETAKTVRVPVSGDTTVESNETFVLNLFSATCSLFGCTTPTIADSQGLGTITNDDGPTTSPTPSATPGPVPATLKVGGYFQARVTAQSPCQTNRLIKVKQSVSGTDPVRAQGKTASDGVFKQVVRPKKTGRFYAQVYDVTKSGASGDVFCRGGKSPIRTLPA
jgi:chitinase